MKTSFFLAVIGTTCLALGCAPTAKDQKVAGSTSSTFSQVQAKPAPVSATASLSWSEQQQIWNDWHADIVSAVKVGNAEDRKILAFMEKYGALRDTNKGTPTRFSDNRFHILVVNGNMSEATAWEQEMGQSPMVFARYDESISSLVVKKMPASFPRKVRGTIGFHEAIHGYHFKTQPETDHDLTAQGHAAEELSAWEPQCRLFRKLYAPSYEPFRQKLIQMMVEDMKVRQKSVSSDRENFTASLPDVVIAVQVLGNPADALKAFGMPSTTPPEELLVPLNFALMDCAFSILDTNYPDRKDAKTMKTAFIGYLNEQAGM